jgi:hypothetical protein
MKLTALEELLWACGFLSSAAVLAVLIWRSRWRRFPGFTAWLAFVTGKTILLYIVYRVFHSGHWYARIYWWGLWPEFALQVGVAVELARAALRRHGKWVGDSGKLFFFAGALGVLFSGLLSDWIAPPAGIFRPWELRVDLFISLVFCELVVSVTLIANWLRLAWDRHLAAIAEGVTAFSVVSLIVTALESYLSTHYFGKLDHFQSYAWIGAMAWIALELGLPTPVKEIPGKQAAGESRQDFGRGPTGKQRPHPRDWFPALGKPRSLLLAFSRRARANFRARRSADEAKV